MAAAAHKRLDVVVLGATGFTGERVAAYLAVRAREDPARKLRWGIAGRSKARLDEVAGRLRAQADDNKDAEPWPAVLVADVKDVVSLADLAAATRLLINCVGPYRFYGEPVVRACVEGRTHYVDVTGEPEFIERMMLTYGEEAARQDVLIVPCCGFDSLAADLGAVFAVEEFYKSFPAGAATRTDAFLTLSAPKGLVGHYATYESFVHGVANADSVRDIRKRLRAKQTRNGAVKVPHVGAKPVIASRPYFEPRVERWVAPFPGSDVSVVNNSQVILAAAAQEEAKEAAAQPAVPFYSEFFTTPSLWAMLLIAFLGSVLGCLARFGCSRRFLLRHPRLCTLGAFSHEGPTQEQIDAASFELRFFTRGFARAADAADPKAQPDAHVETVVSGPVSGGMRAGARRHRGREGAR
jgi:short subunit dehydrogenase-like uncharacterized protein